MPSNVVHTNPSLQETHMVLPGDQVEKLLKISNNEVSPWRIFKIMSEFVEGYEFVRHYKRAVTFFGSARCGFDRDIYKQATRLAYNLAKAGFAIITGGGPGIMEAANRGAVEAGGRSVGLNIQLPMEQRINKYVTESESFHYFFTRKVMLASASQIYIFFPGGYGTMDELFEMLTLMQTGKISPITIILVDKAFWTPLVAWIQETMYQKDRAINKEDLELFHLVDTADEATLFINTILQHQDLNKKMKQRIVDNAGVVDGSCPVNIEPIKLD